MYTYNDMIADISVLVKMGAKLSHIGTTFLGRKIPCLHIGNYSGKQIIIQAAIHAREYITTELVMRQIYYTMERYGKSLTGGIYFVPMVNIDGVMLCQQGADTINNANIRKWILEVNGDNGADFTYWKASCNAVDLNTNFDALWGQGVQNITVPAPSDFIGPSPDSESETQTLINLTKQTRAALTISYHCKGREIYWQFHQKDAEMERDRIIAERLSEITGYTLVPDRGSAGGYKDWCIHKFAMPAFTIEIISDIYQYPIPSEALIPEWERNKDVPYESLLIAQGL